MLFELILIEVGMDFGWVEIVILVLIVIEMEIDWIVEILIEIEILFGVMKFS
jgi:hypothetical protein